MKLIKVKCKDEEKLKKGDFVKNSNGKVGEIENISGDGEIADVKWNNGNRGSYKIGSLIKV